MVSDTPSSRRDDERLGTTIAGRYRLDGVLGEGGMGIVFRATRLSDEAPVALKLLHRDAGSTRRRFLREARLASSIDHPAVVPVIDYARGDHDGPLFLVMQLIDGIALSAVVDRIDPAALTGLLRDVLDGLGHVHARGILHRDVKPDNVLLARRDDGHVRAMLTDFGIAGVLGDGNHDERTRLTREGTPIGTPDFMAPEQAAAREGLTPAVDLYPLGVILYRALAKTWPYQGAPLEVLLAKMQHDAPEPSNLASWPEGQWPLVKRLLARSPGERFAFAADLRQALAPLSRRLVMTSEAWARLRDADADAAATLADATLLAPAEETPPSTTGSRSALPGVWGRADVVAALQAEAKAVADGGHAAVTLLRGPAGSGKSHLVDRLGLDLSERGRAVTLRGAYRDAQGSAGSPLREALARAVGYQGQQGDVLDTLLEGFLGRHDHPADDRDALARFLRGDDADVAGHDAHFAELQLAARVLASMASQRPVLLWIDDVHFSESAALELASRLCQASRLSPMRLWLVMTQRAASGDGGWETQLRQRLPSATRLTPVALEPLATDEVIAGLVADSGLAADTARRVAARCGGNPLLAVLLSGHSDALNDTTPGSVTGPEGLPRELQRRLLDQMESEVEALDSGPAAMEVVRRLAVLGAPAALPLVEAMCDDLDEPFDDLLDALIDGDLLVEDHLDDSLRFRHSPMANAVRSGISRRKLQRLHRRAAEVCKTVGRDLDALAARIAEHLAGAKEIPEAIQWHVRAVQHELRVGDATRARWHADMAAEHSPADAPATAELRLALGLTMRRSGQLDAVEALVTPLLSSRDLDHRLAATELMLLSHRELYRLEEHDALLKEGLALRDQAGPRGQRSMDRALLYSYAVTADWPASLALARRMLENVESPDDHLFVLIRLGVMALIALHDPAQAHAGEREAIRATMEEVADALENFSGSVDAARRADAGRIRVAHEVMRGDTQRAVAIAQESFDMARQAGRQHLALRASIELAWALVMDGAPAASARSVVDQATQLGAFVQTLHAKRGLAMVDMLVSVHAGEPLSPEQLEGVERERALAEGGDVYAKRRITPVLRALAMVDAARQGDWSRACAAFGGDGGILRAWRLPATMVDELAERLASGLAAPDAPPALYDVARKYIAHALEVHGNLFGDDRSRLLAAQSAVDAAFAKTVAQP